MVYARGRIGVGVVLDHQVARAGNRLIGVLALRLELNRLGTKLFSFLDCFWWLAICCR